MKSIQCRNAPCLFRARNHLSMAKHNCKYAENGRKRGRNVLNGEMLHSNGMYNEFEKSGEEEIHTEMNLPSTEDGNEHEEDEREIDENNTKKLAHLFSSIIDEKNKKIVNEIIVIIGNNKYDSEKFGRCVKKAEDCLSLERKEIRKEKDDAGFRNDTFELEFENEKFYGIYYKKDVVECLRKQILLAKSEDIRYRSKIWSNNDFDGNNDRNNVDHPMETEYFKRLYSEKKQTVMETEKVEIKWYEDGEKQSFVGMCQIFTDKTAATLKANSMTAHAVHVTLINFNSGFRRWLIENGHTIVGFLPCEINRVSKSDEGEERIVGINDNCPVADMEDEEDEHVIPLEEDIEMTSRNKGREIKMMVIHGVMKEILEELRKFNLKGFECTDKYGRKRTCHPTICSYCSDIPEGKDMSGIRHNMCTKFPCIRCLSTPSDIKDLKIGRRRTVQEMNVIREHGKVVRNREKEGVKEAVKDLLKDWSLSTFESFLAELQKRDKTFVVSDMYSIFTFEILHNLYLGISKLLKKAIYLYVCSEREVNMTLKEGCKRRKICRFKNSILKACNSILRDIQENNYTPGINIDFSSKDSTNQLNGIYLQDGVRGMLEGKDYRNLDYVFPFIAGFIDKISGQADKAELSEIVVRYSDIVNKVTRKDVSYEVLLYNLREEVSIFKSKYKTFFEEYCENGLFTLKFHLLDHMVEDIERFTSLEYLNSGSYEYFNTIIKTGYRKGSKRRRTALKESINHMEKDLLDREINARTIEIKEGNKKKYGLCEVNVRCNLKEIIEYAHGYRTTGNVKLRRLYPAFKKYKLEEIEIITNLIKQNLEENEVVTMEEDIEIEIMKSGYTETASVPTLEDYNVDNNVVYYDESKIISGSRERIFACDSFGPSKKKIESFVFLRGTNEEGKDEFWFAKTRMLFRVKCNRLNYEEELCFVQFLVTTPVVDAVDKALGCIMVRWETADNVDHSLVDIDSYRMGRVESGENYGIINFNSICGSIQLIRSNYSIAPFTKELPWTHHRFYLNRFVERKTN